MNPKTSKDAKNDITSFEMPKKEAFLLGKINFYTAGGLITVVESMSKHTIQLSNTHTPVGEQSEEQSLPLDEIKANQN